MRSGSSGLGQTTIASNARRGKVLRMKWNWNLIQFVLATIALFLIPAAAIAEVLAGNPPKLILRLGAQLIFGLVWLITLREWYESRTPPE
jgi:hypothetical protein